MSYYTITTYTCMECGTSIRQKAAVRKCKKCSMDLCYTCFSKHKGVCIWCFNEVPDSLLWQRKFASFLFLGPIFLLLIPAPVPIVAFLFRNLNLWWVLLAYTGFFALLFLITRGYLNKKIMDSIPERTPNDDSGSERDAFRENSNEDQESAKDSGLDFFDLGGTG